MGGIREAGKGRAELVHFRTSVHPCVGSSIGAKWQMRVVRNRAVLCCDGNCSSMFGLSITSLHVHDASILETFNHFGASLQKALLSPIQLKTT